MRLGKVGVIVAARLSSSRLPGKAMLPLQGMPMLQFLLRRLRGLKSATLVLATTALAADDSLAALALDEGVSVFRGSETDLVARYVGAAAQFGFDTVARVTADCPFIDAELVDWALDCASRLDHFDLVTTKGRFAVGLDVEIYRTAQMATLAAAGTLSASQREHLTLYFYDHADQFDIQEIDMPAGWPQTERHFTIDTQADYDAMRVLTDKLGRSDFPLRELLAEVTA